MLEDITSNTIAGLISTAMWTAGAALFAVFYQRYIKRGEQKATPRQVAEGIKRRQLRHPLLVFAYVVSLLQIAWNLSFFGLIGPMVTLTTMDSTVSKGPGYDVATRTLFGIILVVLFTCTIPCAVYLTHRIRRLPLLFGLALLPVTWFIFTIEIFAVFHVLELEMFGALAVIMLALIPGVFVGHWIGKRTQQAFTLKQLFKRLTKTDQRQIIDLIEDLPSMRQR